MIVALITYILEIPLIILLSFSYACVWPGKTCYQDDLNGKTEKVLSEVGEKLRKAENKSIFGEIIDNAVKDGGRGHESHSAADLTQITYSGLIGT